jgi:sugar fermentation stimulation protein A
MARGVIVQRYKRFFVDMVLDDGREITAHVPNPGAMLGLKDPGLPPGCRGRAIPSASWPGRCNWSRRRRAGGRQHHEPQQAGRRGPGGRRDSRAVGYAVIRPEVKYSEASRVDFLLTHPDRPPCWLEVKNCHYRRDGTWPSSPTASPPAAPST